MCSSDLTTDGALRIVFIGTGSAFAKRRRQSNMLVIQGDHHVLIDCGTQGPLALNDLGLSVLDVRCYLPTHSHADHIGGSCPDESVHSQYLYAGYDYFEIGRASVGKECRSRWAPYH